MNIYSLEDLRMHYSDVPKEELLEDGSDALKAHIQAWIYTLTASLMDDNDNPTTNRFEKNMIDNPERTANKLFDLIMAE